MVAHRRIVLWIVFLALIIPTLAFSALGDTCYNSVESIPATCTGGEVTTDTWNGCRQLICEGSGSSMQVLACDKSGFFEMYKQAATGSGVSELCIGETCISNSGYAKSNNFPICTEDGEPPVCTPSTEVCDGADNDCDTQIDEGNVCEQPPACTPTTETCNQQDDDCDGSIDEGNVCASGACYDNIQNIPATCEGGSITQDYFDGCRHLLCEGNGGSMKALACDKPGSHAAEYFELYRQAVSGTTEYQICVGSTCITKSGDWKADSGSYPICTGEVPPTCTPSNDGVEICDSKDNDCDGQADEGGVCTATCTPTAEVCDQKDNDCDGSVDENNVCSGTTACFTKVNDMPLKCEGGSITTDDKGGCRQIICASGGNSIQVLACDKPTTASAEYFEMYKQSQTGTAPKVCLGPTCIQNEGFARSGHYPICTSTNTTTCTPSNGGVEICDQKDNDCDGTADEGNVCATPVCGNTVVESGETCDDGNTASGDGCSSTCQTESTQTCYNSVQNIPATCTGATITSDTWNGGRQITCGDLQVSAWDKSGYFEMYKQAGGSNVQLCLGETCISNSGYAKSNNFPICTGTTPPPSGTTNIVWIEPAQDQQNTPTNFFHLNVQVPSNEAQVARGEWEVWNNAQTERVWYADNTGNIRFHTHTPDGVFQGSFAGKSQLNFATTYKVRTRWHYTNGTASAWSGWRTFTTSSQQTSGPNPWTLAAGFQIERVATGFDKPVHIAFAPRGMYDSLPDSQEPYYYVTELYGKVKVVHKDGSISTYAQDILNFDPFGSLTGGGQMGTIGLYVDDATGDLYVGTVYVENEQVKNKVIRFTSAADGNSYTAQQTILSGLPSAPSHQIEQISKGPDGKLYVGLGDALKESNAQSDTVLAGRIIRMNMDGSGVETYAKGLRNPFGHDWRPGTNQLFSTDNSPNTNDRLLKINQGENYLWGQGGSGYVGKAIDLLNPSPVDVEFNPGNSGFPADLTGKMYVAVAGPIYAEGPTNGKQVIEYTLDAAGNIVGERELLKYSGPGYSTPIGMDFGPDGLYITDIYGESGAFDPPEGAIFRVSAGTGGCVNCGEGSFRAGINIVNWYPKYKEGTNQLEYLFECNGIAGSGTYKYDFEWGDGSTPSRFGTSNRQSHLYSRDSGPFDVTCIARDQGTGQTSSATMTIDPRSFVDDGVPGNDY